MQLTVVPAPWMEADSKPWHLMPLPVWEGPGPINKEAWDTSYLLNILMSLAGVSTDLPAFAGSCGLGGRPLLSASGVAANIFCDERDPDSSQTCCPNIFL